MYQCIQTIVIMQIDKRVTCSLRKETFCFKNGDCAILLTPFSTSSTDTERYCVLQVPGEIWYTQMLTSLGIFNGFHLKRSNIFKQNPT